MSLAWSESCGHTSLSAFNIRHIMGGGGTWEWDTGAVQLSSVQLNSVQSNAFDDSHYHE